MVDRTPIQIPPGINQQGSEAEVGAGHWYEGQLIRWISGVLRPVGGWTRMAPTVVDTGVSFVPASPIRKTHTWIALNGAKYTAILCEKHLYVMDDGGVVRDISPTPPIAGADFTEAGGYGEYYYSYDTYGTPRPDRTAPLVIGPMWSLDNWGDDLLAMVSTDGRLLRWKPSDPDGTPAKEVENDEAVKAPHGRFFIVTPERHVMTFWINGDFNSFGWCAQEDVEDWDFTNTTSSAGKYDMQPSIPFVTAVVTRSAIIAFTARSAYAITYMGTPYFYTYNFLGYYNAPVSGNAITQSASGAIWLSDDGFWAFDGATIAPLSCPLLDWVIQTIDPQWRYRRPSAFYLGSHSEVWFFFPEKGAQENTHYVHYNFDEKWWSKGKLSRTCGTPGSAMSYPIMSDTRYLYQHEKGDFYPDAPELPFAQSGAINIASGARQCTARQGIVDTRAPSTDVQFYIAARRDRIKNGSEIMDEEFALMPRTDGGKLDFRVTGRDLILKVQAAKNGVPPWTFGQFLCKLFPRGGR